MSEYIVDIADNPSFGGVLITCGEIVRCRDCKYSDAIKARYQKEIVYACLNFDSADVEPNGFLRLGRTEGGRR